MSSTTCVGTPAGVPRIRATNPRIYNSMKTALISGEHPRTASTLLLRKIVACTIGHAGPSSQTVLVRGSGFEEARRWKVVTPYG